MDMAAEPVPDRTTQACTHRIGPARGPALVA
jgi:hypothetical protein